MSNGTAALPWPGMSPWPTKSAVIRKIIWLLPPMASAVVPTQPSVRGCGGVTPFSQRGRTHQSKVLREVAFLHTQSTTKPLPTTLPPKSIGAHGAGSLGLAFVLLSGVPARRSGGDKSRRVPGADACACRAGC